MSKFKKLWLTINWISNFTAVIDIGQVPIQEITLKELKPFSTRLFLKREDLIDQDISGNKWRKLKYNLLYARESNHKRILTFGGAFSNHIAATAAAGHQFGFETIGVIRGEPSSMLNPTLARAASKGMKLIFLSREDYQKKNSKLFIDTLNEEYGPFHLIPEGGANTLAVKGCKEILGEETQTFDLITAAVGTGTTLAGLILGKQKDQRVIGYPALKNAGFLKEEIEGLLSATEPLASLSFELDLDYHFGGYAKITEELVSFTRRFYVESGIKLDLIYTAKMLFALIDRIKKGDFHDRNVLIIHSGGLQGNRGMQDRFNLGELFV